MTCLGEKDFHQYISSPPEPLPPHPGTSKASVFESLRWRMKMRKLWEDFPMSPLLELSLQASAYWNSEDHSIELTSLLPFSALLLFLSQPLLLL